MVIGWFILVNIIKVFTKAKSCSLKLKAVHLAAVTKDVPHHHYGQLNTLLTHFKPPLQLLIRKGYISLLFIAFRCYNLARAETLFLF